MQGDSRGLDQHEREWYCRGMFSLGGRDEERAEEAEVVGYLMGYAWSSGGTVLAQADAAAGCYYLLFSFPSSVAKLHFLRLCQSNMITRWEHDDWSSAKAQSDDLIRACILDEVLPRDVLDGATVIAAALIREDFSGPPSDTDVN